MPTYSYQVEVGNQLGPLLTVRGDRVSGTPLEKPLVTTMADVLASSRKTVAWYKLMRSHDPVDDRPPTAKPFEVSIKTLGSSGKTELIFQAGTLRRRLVCSKQEVVIDKADAFETDAPSWLAMNELYDLLAKVVEGAAK